MPKKSKKSPKPKKPSHQVRQWALGLSATGLCVAIVAAGIWLLLRPAMPSVAEFLPVDATVAYLEQSDDTVPAELPFFSNPEEWMSFFAPDLTPIIEGLNGQGLLLPGGAVAVLKIDQALSSIALLPYRDAAAIEAYLSASSFPAALVGPYLTIAGDAKALEWVAGSLKIHPPLGDDPLYQKSKGQLPRKPWLRGYFSNASLPWLLTGNDALTFAEPLEAVLNHASFTVLPDPQGLKFNTYLAFQPDVFASSAPSEEKEARVSYDLTSFLGSQDLVAYVGGSNLNRDWQNTLQSLQNMNPAYAIIFEGLLGAQVKKLFGDSVHLRNDLYPLLGGEYAVAVNAPSGDDRGNPLRIKLILSHNDRVFVETKTKKMLEGFRVAAAQFVPRVEIYDLPDGTQSKVLVADPDQIKTHDENYEGYSLSCLEVTGTPYGFCTFVTDKVVVMANSFDGLKETADLMARPRFTLSSYQPFRKGLNQLAQVGDEISFVQLDRLADYLKKPDNKEGGSPLPIFSAFDSATWVKHFFRDGMSAEGYFLLK